MSRFFIDRPIFAWVIALIVVLMGIISITRLPIAQFPNIAPPAIQVTARYPGASAQTAEEGVTQIIEQNMTGLDGLLYMSSSSTSQGAVNITLTFANGTDPDIAQVQVQNRLQLAMPLLPTIVQQEGVDVRKANTGFLLAIGFVSENGRYSTSDIADFLSTNIVQPLSRVPGVGQVQLFGARYAMRIWLDPNKLRTYGLTPTDIISAIQAQDAQVAVGQIGAAPSPPGQELNATVTAMGRLHTPAQFRDIVLRSNPDGSTLRLGQVAQVGLGPENYSFNVEYDGRPASGVGVQLATGANALQTAAGVRALLKQLAPTYPPGVKAVFAFDTTPFIRKSMEEVVQTLLEAIALVFLVMLLFLQNWRATLIPTIAVPVVLMGTFGVLYAVGFSINMLTMFALVLAIGLLVDDAIVVVENVERLMSEEGLSPAEATRRSMRQITGALIGIATVLSAVFVPMAFLTGATGVIYRQFSVTIVSAMVLSVTVAIVVTPALCATLLKPVPKGRHASERRFFRWFNGGFEVGRRRYQGVVARMLARPVRYVVIYLALASIMGLLFVRLPTSYLPNEDQGFMYAEVQAPVNATLQRTRHALDQVRDYFLQHEQRAVASIFTVAGFSFAGGAPNSGIGFVLLKNWSQRQSPSLSVDAIQARAFRALSRIRDAIAVVFAPPPVNGLGNSAGFDFYLEDTNGAGHPALMGALGRLLAMANRDPLLANVRYNGLEDTPQLHLDINSQKAEALGVSMANVNSTLTAAWGGLYVDDFIDRGWVKHVIVQAAAPYRSSPQDFDDWYVRNAAGQMVSLGSILSARWVYGSPELQRYDGLPAVQINGQAAPGVSSGEAMQEIERLAARLPAGFTVNWTGQSYQERAAGEQTPLLYTLSLIVVFLCLAALYESWTIPTAILLAVPLGIIGAVLATATRGLERNVYFQVAMLTTVGLSCKNAILIVEFAKEYVESGLHVIEAILHAVHDRLRPILMTSLAFGFGVLPMALATGAGAGAQQAIGTGVFGGMLTGTFLGIFFIPLCFLLVQRTFHSLRERGAAPAQPPETPPGTQPPSSGREPPGKPAAPTHVS